MNTNASTIVTSPLGKLLAVLSVLTFWVIPFSPLLAIAAVSKTRGSTGWPRTLAVSGAVLCTFFTLLGASIMLWLVCLASLKGSWSF